MSIITTQQLKKDFIKETTNDEIRSYFKSLADRTGGEYDEETDAVYYPSKQVYCDHMRKEFDLNKMMTECIFETANEKVTDE